METDDFREKCLCQPNGRCTFQNIQNGSEQTCSKTCGAYCICPTCASAFDGTNIFPCFALDD